MENIDLVFEINSTQLKSSVDGDQMIDVHYRRSLDSSFMGLTMSKGVFFDMIEHFIDTHTFETTQGTFINPNADEKD
jgi:hypothetical protein